MTSLLKSPLGPRAGIVSRWQQTGSRASRASEGLSTGLSLCPLHSLSTCQNSHRAKPTARGLELEVHSALDENSLKIEISSDLKKVLTVKP